MDNNKPRKLLTLKMPFKYNGEQMLLVKATCLDVSYTDSIKGLTVRFYLVGENGIEHPVKIPFQVKFFTDLQEVLKDEFINLKHGIESDISER